MLDIVVFCFSYHLSMIGWLNVIYWVLQSVSKERAEFLRLVNKEVLFD